jgi:ribulose-phosphate 3-epimerase
LRALLPETVHIQVDGGIDNENVRQVYDAGATLLVAGSAIFGREDLPRSYRRLVQALA